MDPEFYERLKSLQESLAHLKGMQANTNLPLQAPHTLIGGAENMKALFDGTMLRVLSGAPLPNAWELLQQTVANDTVNLARRVFNNVASFDHAVNMGSVLAGQAGVTEGQSQVSPIRTGAADTQTQQPAGSVYPPNRNVDQGGAAATNAIQTSIAGVATQVVGLTDVVTKLADAMAVMMTKVAGQAASVPAA